MESILDQVLRILREISLCDNCLGRQYGNLLTGLTNKQRGFALKLVLGLQEEWHRKTDSVINKNLEILLNSDFQFSRDVFNQDISKNEFESKCELCNGLLMNSQLENFSQKLCALSKELEFQSFLIGSVLPTKVLELEDEIRAKFSLNFGESIKSEVNREIGKKFLETVQFPVDVNFNNPDVVFILNIITQTNFHVTTQINPIFLYGTYKKLIRGIPQAKWDCKHCWGKDSSCPNCNGKGKLYETSVEELATQPLMDLFKASGAKFHGSGREDIDARMLGTGRPFVIELKEPRIRKVNLNLVEAAINESAKSKIEVSILKYTNRDKVKEIKTRSSLMVKKYRMVVDLEKEINFSLNRKKEIEDVFKDIEIRQRTPLRVVHRRVDKIRTRQLHYMKILTDVGPSQVERVVNRLELEIRCEGGLYVKELVNGDNNRTQPNLAEEIGVKVSSIILDVLGVYELADKEEISLS